MRLTSRRRPRAGGFVSAALAALAALLPTCSGPAAPGPPRDLVLVTIDTLRADALLGDGPRRARTPALDGVARAGLAFAGARSHVPLTLPSHANLLTGLLPTRLGLHDNAPFPLRDDVPTLASLLAGCGFSTAAVIGGQPLASGSGIERGFERYDDPPRGSGDARFGERDARAVTDAAIAAWRTPAGDRRRFLFVHYFDPHRPYAPPADCLEPGRTDDVARYLGEVAHVDRELSRLLAELRQGGRRCLLVVTSDHGEGLGDHGERTHGYHVFESTLRVPLIVAEIEAERTGVPAGLRDVDASLAVRMVDLLPTLLRELGVDPPEGLDGVALQDLRGPAPPCFVEAFAGELHFGWAQVTGVRGEGATLLRAGRDVPAAIEGIGAVVPGPSDERLLIDEGAASPADEIVSAWREALAAARADAPAAAGSPSLAPLPELGYVAGSDEADRHLPLPFEENAARVSPLARRAQLDAFLDAVERLGAGDAAGAAALFSRLLDEEPGLRAALLFRARAKLELESGDGRSARAAIDDLATLLALDPGHRGAALLHAKALGFAGEFEAAIDALESLARAGESAPVEHLLGSLLLEARRAGRDNPRFDAQRGFGHLLRSLELDPGQAGLARAVESRLQRMQATPDAPAWVAVAIERLRRLRGRRYRAARRRYCIDPRRVARASIDRLNP